MMILTWNLDQQLNLTREKKQSQKNLKMNSFIYYLLTLFNVDYKTLAVYALIKIDYPPPLLPPPFSHKKHDKNVNKSVKEENRMRIQFFQINPTCWMYVLHILHGHFSPFHFPISFLKMSKEDAFLVFSGTRFHIWGPLYVTVSAPYFTVLLFVENRHWKFLRF